MTELNTMTEMNVDVNALIKDLIDSKVALAQQQTQAKMAKVVDPVAKAELMAPLFKALSQAQAEFTVATASSRVAFKNVDFKFAPLPEILKAVRPALNKYGLALSQRDEYITIGTAHALVVKTNLFHESGASYEIQSVPAFYNASDLKNLGAQITYLRRYEIKSLLGIEADAEEVDMDNMAMAKQGNYYQQPPVNQVPQQTQQRPNQGNSNVNGKANQANNKWQANGARYGAKPTSETPVKPRKSTSQSASTSLSSSESASQAIKSDKTPTSESEMVTSVSATTSLSVSVSEVVSEVVATSETPVQEAPKAKAPTFSEEQLLGMVKRGEESAMGLGATESQLLEWSQLGESQGLKVQLKALSDFVTEQAKKAQKQ